MSTAKPERVQFENPPLVEAVCEFRFAEIGVQQVLVPGRYYERVKAEYSGIESKRGVGVQAGGQEVTMATEEITVFRNQTANRLVQLGSGMLAINQLRPYFNYPTFRKEIEARLADYRAVASPKKITRIGLRYINHVPVAEGKSLETVLNVGIKAPPSLPEKPDPYLVRLVFSYAAGRDNLILITTKAPGYQDVSRTVLDLDYVLVKPDQIEDQELLRWVDNAHDTIEEVFHACVTKAALSSFKPIRSNGGKR
jgi:uncharacterized protein (TIGR04255 family)